MLPLASDGYKEDADDEERSPDVMSGSWSRLVMIVEQKKQVSL